jgi:hypothetical protein
VLAVYFLIAMTESLPLTAFSGWLNNDIKMSQEMQSNFYAVIFLPWVLKPLFGWISDTFPLYGYHRKPYLVLCGVGSAACYVLLATVVTTAPAAFGVTFVRAIFNAFSELMVGTFLADVAHRDISNTGSVQSWGVSARNAGSLVANLLAAGLYTCTHNGAHEPADRAVIGFTAILPLVCAVVSLSIPERSIRSRATVHSSRGSAGNYADANQDEDRSNTAREAGSIDGAVAVAPASSTSGGSSTIGGGGGGATSKGGFLFGMLALQLLFVWLGVRDFFQFAIWWKVLTIYGSAIIVALLCGCIYSIRTVNRNRALATCAAQAAAYRYTEPINAHSNNISSHASRSSGSSNPTSNTGSSGSSDDVPIMVEPRLPPPHHAQSMVSFLPPKNLALVGAFIFLYNVVPSSDTQFSNYQYAVFEKEKCRLQYLSIIGSASSIIASVCYGAVYVDAVVCVYIRLHLLCVLLLKDTATFKLIRSAITLAHTATHIGHNVFRSAAMPIGSPSRSPLTSLSLPSHDCMLLHDVMVVKVQRPVFFSGSDIKLCVGRCFRTHRSPVCANDSTARPVTKSIPACSVVANGAIVFRTVYDGAVVGDGHRSMSTGSDWF